jgi:hypothetical protein
MKPVAEALGISRPHLSLTVRAERRARAGYVRAGDDAVLARIREVVRERPRTATAASRPV